MSKINKRLVSVVICVAALISAVAVFAVRDTRAADYPLIYCNDEAWWLDSLAIVEYSGDEACVPIDVFTKLEVIEVDIISDKGNYILRNTVSGDYIAISSYNKMALLNGVSMFRLNCFLREGAFYTYFYVPIDVIAPLISCRVERYTAPSGRTYIRICDGEEKESFEAVLRRFVPDEFPSESSSEYITETEPPATVAPPTPKNEKQVYLTFDGINEYTGDILDILYSGGITATFFLSAEDIKSEPVTVVRIFTEGHAIGIIPGQDGSLDAASHELAALLAINSRVVRSDELGREAECVFRGGYLFVSGESTLGSDIASAPAVTVLQRLISGGDQTLINLTSSERGAQLVRLLINLYERDALVRFSSLSATVDLGV